MKYVQTLIKSYIFGFLLTYFAIDMWRLATGDLRPLRKKDHLHLPRTTPVQQSRTINHFYLLNPCKFEGKCLSLQRIYY